MVFQLKEAVYEKTVGSYGSRSDSGRAGAAMAMDSATLLENPSQYRVIYADGKKAVYADMATVNAVQSRDLHASIENISFTMYVENYVKIPTPWHTRWAIP